MSLKDKKILITCGGTLEKWDDVRGHTNLARGTIGAKIAEQALSNGAEVLLLHGYFTNLQISHEHLRKVAFEGITDLRDKMHHYITTESFDCIIMTAAVSDWVIDKICHQNGEEVKQMGKIPSDEPPVIYFEKAPKVITEIKDWDPKIFLVGFKLESTEDREILLRRAKERMHTWRADLVVANDSSSLHSVETKHFLLNRKDEVQVCNNKKETAIELIRYLENAI